MTVPTGTAGFSSAIKVTWVNHQESSNCGQMPTYQRESHVIDLQVPRQGDIAKEDLAVERDRVGVELLAIQHGLERTLHRVELYDELKGAAEFEVYELLFYEVVEVTPDPHGHCGEIQPVLYDRPPQCVRDGKDRPLHGGGRRLKRNETVKKQLPRVAQVLVRLYGLGKLRCIRRII